MQAITNNFIVWESKHAELMATRWLAEFEASRVEMNQAIQDLPEDAHFVRAMVDIQIHKGLGLRAYQKHVLETFSYYSLNLLDDDLTEQIIEGTEPADIHDIIEMLAEFDTSSCTEYDVVSIIPLGLNGTVGFVIQPKLR